MQIRTTPNNMSISVATVAGCAQEKRKQGSPGKDHIAKGKKIMILGPFRPDNLSEGVLDRTLPVKQVGLAHVVQPANFVEI